MKIEGFDAFIPTPIPEEQQDKFDEVIRLNYQVEEYYFTLAYFLGMKYGEKISKI